jgi:hypothetical protein
MPYTGKQYSVVTKAEFPVPLCPMLIDAVVSSPMEPQAPASLQYQLMSDDIWTQLVFFLNNDPSYAVTGGFQVGFGITQWTNTAEYFPFTPDLSEPSVTAIRTVYTPTGTAFTVDNRITDDNDNPILVSDFMEGRYIAEVFNNPTNATVSARLLDLSNLNILTHLPTQVWSSGVPNSLNTLPKSVNCVLVGLGEGESITFTQGGLRVRHISIQSTVQSGPNQGDTIEPQQLDAFLGDPTYTDSETGNIYDYALSTGEASNLNSILSDDSPTGQTSTILQTDSSVMSSGS